MYNLPKILEGEEKKDACLMKQAPQEKKVDCGSECIYVCVCACVCVSGGQCDRTYRVAAMRHTLGCGAAQRH